MNQGSSSLITRSRLSKETRPPHNMKKCSALLIMAIVGIIVLTFVAMAHADQNLALTGIATESSYGDWGGFYPTADRAIDVNTDGDYYHGSVAHTHIYYPSWWQVDLRNTYHLNEIVLWNRTDGGWGSRLTNFYVSVMDKDLNTVWIDNFYTTGGTFMPSMTIDLPENTYGNIVKVGLNDEGYLQLAEVQVFGQSPVPEPTSMLLLGLGLIGLPVMRKCK